MKRMFSVFTAQHWSPPVYKEAGECKVQQKPLDSNGRVKCLVSQRKLVFLHEKKTRLGVPNEKYECNVIGTESMHGNSVHMRYVVQMEIQLRAQPEFKGNSFTMTLTRHSHINGTFLQLVGVCMQCNTIVATAFRGLRSICGIHKTPCLWMHPQFGAKWISLIPN